jgi:branched-chain amino acid transport system ATP-binding protein
MQPRDGATLEAHRITVRFGGLTALERVDLSLRAGEILGLIGPNGAGKTTLVNVLSGFQVPTDGEVTIDGKSATGTSPRHLSASGVARTFQAGRLFEALTVIENVSVAGVAAGLSVPDAERRAREILEWIGCAAEAETRASDLSYGRERLVGIARALATSPAFLLLDEPAAGLDDRESKELGDFIKRLPEERGCGILLIEHNVDLVLDISARIHVLDGGRTIAVGNASEIVAHPDVRRAYLG